jgi:hypothetical protein
MNLMIENLNNRILKLENKNNELENRIVELENKRNEIYYQKFLEKQFSASHKRTVFGITDITTEKEHIEIKHWKNYKAALGQLLSYNHNDNKDLVAYFFGDIDKTKQENIIDLFKSKQISVYEFIDTVNGIEINTLYNKTINNDCSNEQIFKNWLQNKIQFSENSYMNLEQICSNFLQSNINNHLKCKYKNIIQEYIKINIKNVKWEYGVVKIHDKTYKGWKHLAFYNENH